MVKIIDYSNPDVRRYAAESIIQTTAEFIKMKADMGSASNKGSKPFVSHETAEKLISLVTDSFLLEGEDGRNKSR